MKRLQSNGSGKQRPWRRGLDATLDWIARKRRGWQTRSTRARALCVCPGRCTTSNSRTEPHMQQLKHAAKQ